MHCPACEFLVADEVGADPDVVSARARRSDDRLWVEVGTDDGVSALKTRWNTRLAPLGYRLWLEEEDPVRETRKETAAGAGLGIGFLVLFAALQVSGLVDLFSPDSLGVPGAFFLGLLASVSSCFALVGGLLVSYTAAVARRNPAAAGSGLLAFHSVRLGVFFAGGGLLGWAGGALGTSMELQRVLLTAAALVMTGLGANLLGAKLPGLGKGMKRTSHAKGMASWGTLGGGALLGALTFVLPCGFTQSVQFQALASGSFWEGAWLTLAFALGTLPVLASVGWLLSKGIAGKGRAVMLKAGGTVVLGLGLYQLWGASHLWGFGI